MTEKKKGKLSHGHSKTNKYKKNSTKESRRGFEFIEADFSKENFLEGALLRPAVLLISFISFLVGVFLMLLGVPSRGEELLMWGGSAVIFAFVLNIQSIYFSLNDEPSYFRTMNLVFKLILFIAEIVAFNFLLTLIL